MLPGDGRFVTPLAEPGLHDATASSQLLNAPSEAGRLRLELIRCLRSDGFDHVDLVVSFIMRSGLNLILSDVDDAIARGANVRVRTTDYMDITDPDALAQLLDLQEASRTTEGQLSVRVWQASSASLHPKAYLFWSSTGPLARGLVGSSNLSKSGIDGEVEWNLSVTEVGQLRPGLRTTVDGPPRRRSRPPPTAGEPSGTCAPSGQRSAAVKGLEFQHVVLVMTPSTHASRHDGFEGSGKARYNQFD